MLNLEKDVEGRRFYKEMAWFDALKTFPIYKLVVILVGFNVVVFHLDKVFLGVILFMTFFSAFFYYLVNNEENKSDFTDYLNSNRQINNTSSTCFIKIDPVLVTTLDNQSGDCLSKSSCSLDNSSPSSIKQKTSQSLNIKPSLTGSYLIDEELHQIIDLFIRDYVNSWFKSDISNKDDFSQYIRRAVYNGIRHINLCMKTIDWEHFIMNILTHNLVIQMRMLKKAKEKRDASPSTPLSSSTILNKLTSSTNVAITPTSNSNASSSVPLFSNFNTPNSFTSSTSINPNKMLAAQSKAALNETSLIETFYELEAEIEKGICRDNVTFNSPEKEHEFLQELSEILCYSFLSSRAFNCLPLRCLIREILANHLVKVSIDNLTDPDYINQTILYWCQDQAPLTENFLTTINHCESIDELYELLLKIEEEILKTRSNDTGGQNDQEIKLKLSSLQFVKKRIESCLTTLVQPERLSNKKSSSNLNTPSGTNNIISNSSDDEYKIFLFNQLLENLEFTIVLTNETVQHCFIEFMGKKNVQNLISFYLNADMYRQYARKELIRNSNESTNPGKLTLDETRQALKEFAKGLINSYLLSAINFSSNNHDDDEPVNILNRVYYKPELTQTIERLETNVDSLNESLLDELQAKIYLLMKQKYFIDFKNYTEFHKILLKNDFIFKYFDSIPLSSNTTPLSSGSIQTSSTKTITNPIILADQQHILNMTTASTDNENILFNIDDDLVSPASINNSSSNSMFDSNNAEADSSSLVSIDSLSDRMSQSSFEFCSSFLENTTVSNKHETNFKLSAIISSCGRCNEQKTTYAIYIIDVVKDFGDKNKNEYWQTYRRFNDFYDLHLIIKKKIPSLSNFVLPGKSFRNSLSEEFLEKRRIELNRYLQTLCNPSVISNHPQLLELLLNFLENKRWENKQTNFKRRVDSFLTPMISSVQSFQTTIKNAPDNVIGMVKGISDNLLTNSITNMTMTSSSATISSANNQNQSSSTSSSSTTNSGNNRLSQSISSNQISSSSSQTAVQNSKGVNQIERTILNGDDLQSNNIPVRVIILLIDEIFDLKEKNLVKSLLMAIVKTFMKNFKGDSMNRKIKEQIADYLSEEYIARYLKNFRKRIWPKGVLSEASYERSKSVKEITKVLVKTKLLALVSDELRHIIGTDTTRRGIFELFDLFQHRPLNKRLFHILTENLLVNLFQMPKLFANLQANTQTNILNTMSYPNASIVLTSSQTNLLLQQQLLSNPFKQLIRSHLSKSSKIKNEWKISAKSKFYSPQSDAKEINDKNKNHRRSISNSYSAHSLVFTEVPSSSLQLNSGNVKYSSKQLSLETTPDLNKATNPIINDVTKNENDNSNSSHMTRSKSLFNEIQC